MSTTIVALRPGTTPPSSVSLKLASTQNVLATTIANSGLPGVTTVPAVRSKRVGRGERRTRGRHARLRIVLRLLRHEALPHELLRAPQIGLRVGEVRRLAR